MSTYRRMNLDLFFFYHNEQNTDPNEELNVKPKIVETAWKKNSGSNPTRYKYRKGLTEQTLFAQ